MDNERAVQFRKWANKVVKDYTIKGWVMDDERLKQGKTTFGVEFNKTQKITSDFDKAVKQILEAVEEPATYGKKKD